MSVHQITDMKLIEKLYENWQETSIWSCLQGIMGRAWAEDDKNPKSAQIIIGDFCFFAGEPNMDLVSHKPMDHTSDFIIMVPRSEAWNDLIEQYYGERARKVVRYAIKKEKDVFDVVRLREIVNNLSKDYQIQLIDKEIYNQAMSNPWSKSLCGNFENYEDYQNRGLGVAITHHGTLVAGASSYSVYREGIEVEIDTREDYRRRGLALACGARLILECLNRGLYPSWDAQNKGSRDLAEKLGYHFDKEYTAYEVWGY